MKYDTLDPESTVLKLSSRAYTAAEVANAVGITPGVLTNYLTKSQIRLLTEPQGRGRSRKFHLADVYALSIMKSLVQITGSQDWSARVVEYMLFLPDRDVSKQQNPLSFLGNIHEIRENLLAQIRELRPAFYHRNWHTAAWILFVEDIDVRSNLYGFKFFRSGEKTSLYNDPGFLLGMDEGHFINITYKLTTVDKSLCNIVGNDLW